MSTEKENSGAENVYAPVVLEHLSNRKINRISAW
jgi:hypothetical protein